MEATIICSGLGFGVRHLDGLACFLFFFSAHLCIVVGGLKTHLVIGR